jgi:hypothetical protein
MRPSPDGWCCEYAKHASLTVQLAMWLVPSPHLKHGGAALGPGRGSDEKMAGAHVSVDLSRGMCSRYLMDVHAVRERWRARDG